MQGKPSNRHFWHSTTTTAGPEKIWEIWTDVPDWYRWDQGLKTAEMNEAFTEGGRGTITALNGRKTPFEITQLDSGRQYTFVTDLPLGGLRIRREVIREREKTVFTHEVWFDGPSAWLFSLILGPQFRRMLPGSMDLIKAIAEQ